jgi:unsaturated rhamnogalacturonyl hydrolase
MSRYEIRWFTSVSMVVAIAFGAARAPASPLETGHCVAQNIVSRSLGNGYAIMCSYDGVMIFSEATGDTSLSDRVIAAYQPYLTGQSHPLPVGHVDNNVFGIVPFEIYRQTQEAQYLPLAVALADAEFANPRSDGLSSYTRFWVDDLYMVCSLQAQAYKSLEEPRYVENGVTQLLGYISDVEDLQQSNGLFHHSATSPYFWGRGNGWAAAAMTETLLAMPIDHPRRAEVLAAYRQQMAGLLAYQDSSGLWYQLVNLPDDPRNWLETSCTGMFVFALATGVNQGWLVDPAYSRAAIKGWQGLEGFINVSGDVEQVCVGTSQGNSLEYYFNRPQSTGDAHGQAGAIWAATAMVRAGLPLAADFDMDDDVDFADYSLFADHWGAESTSQTVETVPPSAPANHWTLDQTSGPVAFDSGSLNLPGVVIGAAWDPAAGRLGGCAQFGGSDADRIMVPTNALSAAKGTVCLWARLGSDPQPSRVRYLFGHSYSQSYTNRIQLYLDESDRELDVGLGSSHIAATNVSILYAQDWYHIALAWKSGRFTVYVNGLPEAEGTFSGLTDPLTALADIGNNGRVHDQAFHGWIDDVRFYDYALSAPEAAYLAGANTQITIPLPAEAVGFDLHRDDAIDAADLAVLAQTWLEGK